MTLYKIKPAFQDLLRPLTRALHSWEVTANQVTIFAISASISLGMLLICFPL